MKTPVRFIISILLAAAIFAAGYLANRHQDPAVSSASDKQLAGFICPMHPQYKSDHNGTCPICGMSLVPASGVSESDGSGMADQNMMVRVNADKQQLIGVRVDEVKQAAATQSIRVPGRIAVDEQRLYRIIAAADGWIRDLGNNPAGSFVRKNQILGSYYTPNLVAAIQTYIFALQTNAQSQTGSATIGYQRGTTVLSLQVALDSLRSVGMSDYQIEEIARTRVAPEKINIYSPVNGYVIARNISPEQQFDKGSEMYRIADIGHVWVMTDIFEKDREFLKPGASATVLYQGRQFQARMSDVLPQFDPQSRILKTRFELENPGSILLPDMFVDVELQVSMPPSLSVPSDAVIDSGLRKTVYVQKAGGTFEPRLIQTGWRLGDRVQVNQGLMPGERIVVSGNFLIDSETRMKQTGSAGAAPAAEVKKVKDLVCGMDVDRNSSNTLKTQYQGKTYYFCSEHCKKIFEANPGKYVKTTEQKATKVKDLVCGMEIDPNSPDTLKTQYKGKTYYFCNESCKKSFEAAPERYVGKGMAPGSMHMMRMSE